MEQFAGSHVTEVNGLPLNTPLPREVIVLGIVTEVKAQL